MKKLSILLFAMMLFLPSFADELIKIKCECVYGEKVTIDVPTQNVLDRNTDLINKPLTLYFYLDDKNKQVFDSNNKKRNVIHYDKDKIYIMETTAIKNPDMTNLEMFTINRNDGYIEGTLGFEYNQKGRLKRNLTGIYGECSKVDTNSKF